MKHTKQFVLFLLALIVSAFLASCQVSYSFPDGPDEEKFREKERQRFATIYDVPVNGCEQLSYSEHEVMEFRAKVVPREVWASVKSININDDATHFNPKHVMHCHATGDSPSGAREWRNGDICIKPEYTKDIVFWHEICHAAHLMFNETKGIKLEEEWLEITGDVYGYDKVQPGETFPSRGLMREYSAESPREAMADAFMYIHAEVYGKDTPYDQLRARGLLTKDSVYRSEVEFFWKHGFLTSEVYHKFTDPLD